MKWFDGFMTACWTFLIGFMLLAWNARADDLSLFSSGEDKLLVFSEPDSYASLYRKSVETGQGMTVMYGSYSIDEILSASSAAAQRGEMFYQAKASDGFQQGIYRLAPRDGVLYYVARLMVCNGQRCRL